MLSIGAGHGNGSYYLASARADYYLKGGEPLGLWWGNGSEKLVGLGTVQDDEFKALLKGFSPTGEKLTQNAGHKDRQSGWDLTFSAPKSVSLLWAQADQGTQRQIQAAHLEAVKAALSYLQDEVAYTRRGKAGNRQEHVGLCVAIFEHGSSRELQAALHSHAFVINIGVRDDGTTGTILSKPLYQAKMAAGALYRAELATRLEQACGIQAVRESKGTSFKVLGVPDELCKDQSKRRADIKDVLKSLGSESAAAAAYAASVTRREKKEVPPRSSLFAGWQAIGESFGFSADQALHRRSQQQDQSTAFNKSLSRALSQITESQSHFTEQQLVKHVAVESQGHGLSAKFIREQVKAEIKRADVLISLGSVNETNRYTTKDVLDAEKKLIDSAARLDSNKKHGLADKEIEKALDTVGTHLTDEQRDAIRFLTRKGGGLRSLEGIAGTGKTSTLAVAREILEYEGYHLIGATLSAKAAKELEKGARVASNTIALVDLKMRDADFKDVLKHEEQQIGRALIGKDRRKMFEPLTFDKTTVLVIDESAMVATKELAKLTAAIEKAGGMLISVFDRKQLQAIGPGGGAAFLADKFGKTELNGIVRQHEEWMRDAVRQFGNGDAAAALKQYELAGRLHVAADRKKAITQLVSDWDKHEKGARDRSLIFVGSRAEVQEVNARCQAARRDAGELIGKPREVGEHKLYHGDRVLFTKNSKSIGVENGTLGTAIGFHPVRDIAIVKCDSGDTVHVPLKEYKGIQPGYAVTTHKGQGTTVDNAYLLVGGKMQDRHLSVVQASRAREITRIYTDRHEAGDKLSQLAKQMSQEREKTLAHEIQQRAQEQMQRKSQTQGMRI